MKNTFLACMLLAAYITKAQGPQQLITVPYDSWPGATVKGWLYLPADYATSTKNYPVVFFYHGLGEAGTNPYTMLNQGLPNLIANGMRPDNITNPVDGQQYSFIVLSVQHWSWSPNPNWLPYELQWLKQNYRIDTNRVYVTGLSAGGQQSYSATIVNDNVSKLIAAAVPMSPAQVWPYDPTLIGSNKIETWFFAGNSDGGYTNNATTYNIDCNTQYPGSSKLSIYSGGHCCWNTYYSPSWHDPVSGRSVWEWMLTNTRQAANPLPVDFVSLDVKKEMNGIQLRWKVGEEQNVSGYEVEKSADGKSFTRIGFVPASGQNQYAFTDVKLHHKSFYRIKNIDHDGKYKYSSIVSFNSGKTTVVLKAFPMPATNELTIQHPTAAGNCNIFIYSSDGKMVKTLPAKDGAQQTTMDISSLQKGSYFVRYDEGNGNIETIKISKQ